MNIEIIRCNGNRFEFSVELAFSSCGSRIFEQNYMSESGLQKQMKMIC